ncbi:hypothetical protein TNCV_1275111 [Trichonephila clavipes]|nr:hypothetical protein TNCV_1275111 [Trichonephila clavipes]
MTYSTPTYANLESCDFQISSIRLFSPITETQIESAPELDDICNVIEEVVYLARLIIFEADSGDIQELLDTHYQELTIDELVKMHKQSRALKNSDSLDPLGI